MYHYTRHLITRSGGDPKEQDTALAVAAAFHDLRFATDQTLDYLPPSIEAAAKHLDALGLSDLDPSVRRLIGFHHKLTPYRAAEAELVEPFRRAGLVVVFGVPGVGVAFAVGGVAQAA